MSELISPANTKKENILSDKSVLTDGRLISMEKRLDSLESKLNNLIKLLDINPDKIP